MWRAGRQAQKQRKETERTRWSTLQPPKHKDLSVIYSEFTKSSCFWVFIKNKYEEKNTQTQPFKDISLMLYLKKRGILL